MQSQLTAAQRHELRKAMLLVLRNMKVSMTPAIDHEVTAIITQLEADMLTAQRMVATAIQDDLGQTMTNAVLAITSGQTPPEEPASPAFLDAIRVYRMSARNGMQRLLMLVATNRQAKPPTPAPDRGCLH